MRHIIVLLLGLVALAAHACSADRSASATASESCATASESYATATESCATASKDPATAPEATAYAPGDTVPETYISAHGTASFFSVDPIPDAVFQRMQGGSYSKDCTTSRTALRYLRCLHVTADGYTLVGEMVLHESIAADVLGILRQLYAARYPIERMRLVDDYGADDQRSMAANNSSAFNFRFVSGTRKVSKHGLGLAVDINPLYNPCRRTRTLTVGGKPRTLVIVEPVEGRPYTDRTKQAPYMMQRDDLCCRLFREAGFKWGGDWKHTKDYQHFEK